MDTSLLPDPHRAGRRASLHFTSRRLMPVVLLLILVGCNSTPTPTPEQAATPLTPQVGSNAVAAVDASLNASGDTSGDTLDSDALLDDQLVLWLPPLSGLAAEGNAGMVFNNAFVQFEQQNPGIQLDIQVKAETGAASMLNYLRNAQQAAPMMLPDLVLINTQQLWQLVDLGMVQSIDETEIVTNVDFFDVARTAVVYREQWMGIPYALDIVHLLYDPAQTSSPPADWEALLAADQPYLFPGAEAAPLHELLLQYTGAGGVLRVDGTIEDPAALQAYFDFVATARSSGIIPSTVLDLASYLSVWREFSADPQSVAAVQINQFFPNATGTALFGYGPIPTRTGATLTMANTWAFAVLTPDAARRRTAVALVNALLAPEVHGPWSQFASRLPSQNRALAMWTQSDDYRIFLQGMLDNAQTPPNGLAFAEFARRLQTTRASLIRGDVSVQEAMQLMLVTE